MFDFLKNLSSQEQANRRKSEKTQDKYTRWEGLEKGQHPWEGDPVNKFHADDSGRAEPGVVYELTEDDFLPTLTDPDFDPEDIADGHGFESKIARTPDPEFVQELCAEYDIWMSDYAKRKLNLDDIQTSEQDIPFEEQDLSQQWKKPTAEITNDSVAKSESLDDGRGMYSADEFLLMKQCVHFSHEYFKKGNKSTPRPTFANGTLLNNQQLKQVVNEYYDFKKSAPQEFADMKVKLGDWNKQEFLWKENNFRGQQQWVAYQNGKMFISNQNPKNFLHSGNESYFTKENTFTPEGKNREMVWVTLQMPVSN